ncbi:MAG: nitroreductase [Bacillota bacterium]|nr:nitroreductase [Bacillota bacterium]
MDIIECINSRRSGRIYTDELISEETMTKLIELGTKAPTGSGLEPWGFVIIRDKEEIDSLSEMTKKFITENLERYPYLQQYSKWMTNPKFHVFNRANTLLLIYGNPVSHWYVYDCSMAAGNIMLAAHSMGIGTCWIGFAEHTLNTKEFKEKHGVPGKYELISAISMGYMKMEQAPPKRKEPLIFSK